ncbi:unnamed protein product [marine sediment metagenome]|uniref:Uncharacterized protein n=1 Tax=marine sediment metagenome TaxID=412755 RepID=X1DID2_9ZZZZ
MSEDGEAIVFVVAGEPQLLESKYKNQVTQRVAAPLITLDGFTLLIMGKRLARRLSKHEAGFGSQAFIAVRHGEERDINTTYELKVLDDVERTAQLFELLSTQFEPSMVDEAITAAKDIMSS